MHWLDDSHVTALLAPYICEGWDTGDYARFADLCGADARTLRTLLPPLAREDRQNNAPRITDLLRAATRIDGLTLDGYVIRAPRWDERVSVDTVCVPESAVIAHTGRPRRSPPTSTGSPSPTCSDWGQTPSHPTRCASSCETHHPRDGGGHGGTNQLP